MNGDIPTVIGLGRLVDFVIRDAQGQRLRLTPQGEQWLAWKPETRDLVILRPGNGGRVAAKHQDVRRHRRFHGAAPEYTRAMEWPAQRGSLRSLGLIESVTYVATGIHSPSKQRYHWAHQFGDCGEHGHGRVSEPASGTYSEQVMPRLDVDAVGNLFLVRRPGNRFSVRDWIIG